MALTYDQIQAAAKKKGLGQSVVDQFAKKQGVVVPPMIAKAASNVDKSAIVANAGTTINPNTGANYQAGYAIRKPPTGATPSNPVVTRQTSPGNTTIPDYSSLDGLDKDGLQRYIDSVGYDVKINKATRDDILRAQDAQRRFDELVKKVDVIDPNKKLISDQEAEKAAKDAELKTKRDSAVGDYESYLNSQADRARAKAQESAAREEQSQQSASSFSGFGRSTFNQDQIGQIQKRASEALDAIEQTKQLELSRYRAEQEGADAETLQSYDNQISTLRQKSGEREQSAIQHAVDIDTAQGKSNREMLDNALAAATQTAKKFEDLTDQDKQTIQSFAAVALNEKGQLDMDLLKTAPAGLSGYIINEAAKLKGGLPGEAAKTVTVGSGKNAREYQWNPKTKLYDIPVGNSGFGGGGGSGGGNGNPLPGVDPKDAKLVELLVQYKGILDQNSVVGLQTNPTTKALADNLVSQITAEYKQAKKLGTLDNGVIKLINGLVGKGGGVFSPASYSTSAQSQAVEQFLGSLGYQGDTTTKKDTTATPPPPPKTGGRL